MPEALVAAWFVDAGFPEHPPRYAVDPPGTCAVERASIEAHDAHPGTRGVRGEGSSRRPGADDGEVEVRGGHGARTLADSPCET
jgi:hypothetical protein